ncbi:response regulator transcription factor [Methylibium rhizosphaerae]|uniref:response regulator transcription factor n=1 Tax=Methylibium rhizosphaerae TaxID=2570323 RepID=UPI00112EC42F|nr:response regulator [Methylibium rhizosphaerae]
MTKKTILIADDEPNIVISLEYMLQQSGYDVMVAHDGQEAVEAIARRVPDLLLLDIMMPRLSGYDVCQRIRESEAWRDIRIVMLSAKGREVEIAKGLALGADAYVTKPFSTRELLTQIHALLGD